MNRLASSLRPSKLDEIYGQDKLIKMLKNMLDKDFLPSMILYGPSGSGKTTVARCLGEYIGKAFYLNAAINKIKDFDEAIKASKLYKKSLFIVDEIHRLNRDKQDILLPHIEEGDITLIGLTTSNPIYAINPALRSRCSLFEVNRLNDVDVIKALNNKKIKEELPGLKLNKDAASYIAKVSSGDLRYAYNLLENAYFAGNKEVTRETLKAIGALDVVSGDSKGDEHYNLLSAFQKSIRGSHVDASLHYLARLLLINDLESIARRLTVIAFEDISLANINALTLTLEGVEAAQKVGMPEARIIFANIVIYLCLSPKSNRAYLAIDKAISDVKRMPSLKVPDNISTKELNYLYPHNYPGSVVKQPYLPEEIKNAKYYEPGDTNYEKQLKKIKEKLDQILWSSLFLFKIIIEAINFTRVKFIA